MNPATHTTLHRVLQALPGNACATQRQRILTALTSAGPLTTQQIQTGLDVPRPASRIDELRSSGAHILTALVHESTPAGVLHRFARYSLGSPGAARVATAQEGAA